MRKYHPVVSTIIILMVTILVIVSLLQETMNINFYGYNRVCGTATAAVASEPGANRVALIVSDPAYLDSFEKQLHMSIAKNYTVVVIDDDDIGATNFADFNVTVETANFLELYLRDFVSYRGYNVICVAEGLRDITRLYGGSYEYGYEEAITEIVVAHNVTAGFNVGDIIALGSKYTRMRGVQELKQLDANGYLWAGEPNENGRLVAIGMRYEAYADGLSILDSALQWAINGTGTSKPKPYTAHVGLIVNYVDSLTGFESSIRNRLIQDGYTVTLIDSGAISPADIPSYDVIIETGDYLEAHLRNFVNYEGYNVICLSRGLQDVTRLYGGNYDYYGTEETTISIINEVTTGFNQGDTITLSTHNTKMIAVSNLTQLDATGHIYSGAPNNNGRLVAIGLRGEIYPDGFTILENAIEWAKERVGAAKVKPYTGDIGLVVSAPDVLSGFESSIKNRLTQDGYTVTLIGSDAIATAPLSSYDVIIETDDYLEAYLRNFVNYEGYNVICLCDGLQDITRLYGGEFDHYGTEQTTLTTINEITAGFVQGATITLSSENTKMTAVTSLVPLDANGHIYFGEPNENGRLVAIGLRDQIYADGFMILENAIEWAMDGRGSYVPKPYVGNLALIIGATGSLTGIESSIKNRYMQDGYTVTPVNCGLIATFDFSTYDVIIETDAYLSSYLKDFVENKSYDVICIGDGMLDIAHAYGGSYDYSGAPATTTLSVTHTITEGLTVGQSVTLATESSTLTGITVLTQLDTVGHIHVGEPDNMGRLIALGMKDQILPDGFVILDNAIKWTRGYVTGWLKIEHVPVDTSIAGEPITIVATVTTNIDQLPTVTLYYRIVGELEYHAVTMTSEGDTIYRGIIPASAVTTDGVEYYIFAQVDNLTATHPGNVPTTPPHKIVVTPSLRIDAFKDNETGTIVTVQYTGEGSIIIEKLSTPPGPIPEHLEDIDIFIDISISGTMSIDWVYIEIPYTIVPIGNEELGYNETYYGINLTEEWVEVKSSLSEVEHMLRMFRWDAQLSRWIKCLHTDVDVENNIVWANVTHLTVFAPLITAEEAVIHEFIDNETQILIRMSYEFEFEYRAYNLSQLTLEFDLKAERILGALDTQPNIIDINIFIEFTPLEELAPGEWVYIEVTYDETMIPEGFSEADLRLYYWDDELSEWVRCEHTDVDTYRNVVWANVTHFTIFAPMVEREAAAEDKAKAGPVPFDQTRIIIIIVAAVFIAVIALAVVVIVKKRRKPPSPPPSAPTGEPPKRGEAREEVVAQPPPYPPTGVEEKEEEGAPIETWDIEPVVEEGQPPKIEELRQREAAELEVKAGEPVPAAMPKCESCARELYWIEQYQRWYCYGCQKYA